jgi:hypothetical protein
MLKITWDGGILKPVVYKRLYKNLVKIMWDGGILKPVVYKRLYKTVTEDHHSNSQWY